MQTLRPLAHAIAVAVLCSSTLANADSGSIVRDSVRIDHVRRCHRRPALRRPEPGRPGRARSRRRSLTRTIRRRPSCAGVRSTAITAASSTRCPAAAWACCGVRNRRARRVIPGATFGLIPGVEYQAYLRVRDAHGHVNNVPAAVQIPRAFQPGEALPGRGGSLGLAQRLGRHRHRRVGAVQGLRGGASRQGHRHRLSPARQGGGRLGGRRPRRRVRLGGRDRRRRAVRAQAFARARRLRRRQSLSHRDQARALAAQPRAPVGPVRARGHRVRVLGAERPLRKER